MPSPSGRCATPLPSVPPPSIAEAVTNARQAGVSWSAIGGMLGTSGEAARKRYAVGTKTG